MFKYVYNCEKKWQNEKHWIENCIELLLLNVMNEWMNSKSELYPRWWTIYGEWFNSGTIIIYALISFCKFFRFKIFNF